MCAGAQNNSLRIALRALIFRSITSAPSGAAPSYFRGSLCRMRNSLLQCWHVAVLKRIVLRAKDTGPAHGSAGI